MYSVHSVDNTGTLPVGRCAHAVNIQSALGVAVFVASVILHHAMPPSDMRQLASSQSISIVSPIEVVKLTMVKFQIQPGRWTVLLLWPNMPNSFNNPGVQSEFSIN